MDNKYQVAARWWANQLRVIPKHEMGDVQMNADVAILSFLTMPEPLPEEKIQQFEQELATLLESAYNATVTCEYGPDYLLDKAARQVGISLDGRLPMKTTMTMWSDTGTVEVSKGFGVPYVQIYPEPDDTDQAHEYRKDCQCSDCRDRRHGGMLNDGEEEEA